MRAGGYALNLLATPRVPSILGSLAEGTKGRQDLRRDAGLPAQSTLRNQLESLEAVGVLEKRRPESFPGAFEYDLTESGRDLLAPMGALERWLGDAPQGPLALGTDRARAATRGFVDGWLARMLAPLATGTLSLTGLDKHIGTLSYPALERRLDAMRLAEQVVEGRRDGAGTPYVLTDWLRLGIGPLVAGARWERRHQPEGAEPIARLDIESAFRVAAPLVDLPPGTSGICELVARASRGQRPRRHLGLIEVDMGSVAFGSVYPQRKPDAWASGAIDDWFAAIVDGDVEALKVNGERSLPLEVFGGLHRFLFSRLTPTSPASFPDKTD